MLICSHYMTDETKWSSWTGKAKRALKKAFENQKLNKGISVVEIVSNCTSGWKMPPIEANKWMEENMFPFYPLGDLKVDGELVQK